ncbi:MAG: helix-turn-helix transcriptional regulator [Sciscionella sp.]
MSPSQRRDDFDAQIGSLALLGEPVRRALYRYVVAQPSPVSREQAAHGVGVAHHVAKFNLDKLENDGLLEVELSRPPGRRGPGAGRPAKLYRRSSRDITVSLPERRYDLASRVMAEAITAAADSGLPVTDALRRAASATGRAIGDDARHSAGTRPQHTALIRAVSDVLTDNGYEPRTDADGITLVNCPFHHLAKDYTALICGMNLDLIKGMLDALGQTPLHAQLDPSPGQCCVTLSTLR